MATLIPTASACHSLQLPPTEKDDRLNLNVRTGSASTLYNSLVFTYGGLTMGLELKDFTIEEIRDIFQSKINASATRYRSFDKYLSGELFYLSLIERVWTRVTFKTSTTTRPSPRLLHQLCAVNNCIYLFGGLTIPENQSQEKYLIPCNDLWEFNLEKNKWTCLHDGAHYHLDKAIPCPRYNHKITPISSLSFVNRKDHFGIFIGGGKDENSNMIYDNAIFDLVEKKYVGSQPIHLSVTSGKPTKDQQLGLTNFIANDDHLLNVDITKSMLIDFVEEVEAIQTVDGKGKLPSTTREESLVVYAPTQEGASNPLVSFKIGKMIKHGKPLPIHRKTAYKKQTNITIPFNLSYPSGGLFGQNVVITGFLENEFDISIFIYNKPTGKWSRMNIFCNHDYGSHRFWGGFAWQSHHKVILLGNYLTSRTSSSIRFFTLMITVSLPITNILASSELAGGHHHAADGTRIYHHRKLDDSSDECSTDSSSSAASGGDLESHESSIPDSTRHQSVTSVGTEKSNHTPISFTEYVHYAAPKQTFTTIRSVFPPAAITLGRNAFDRYGDLVSDFEIVSSNGDRIPVCLVVLMERWGRYFISLLSRGYVQAVDKFESDQAKGLFEGQRLRSKASNSSSTTGSASMKLSASGSSVASNEASSDNNTTQESTSPKSQSAKTTKEKEDADKKTKLHLSMHLPRTPKDAPQFRLPFQDSSESSSMDSPAPTNEKVPSPEPPGMRPNMASYSSAIDPHQTSTTTRKGSVASFQSSHSSLLTSHLQDIPPQLPLPVEPIPAVPVTSSFRSSSRKGSQDHSSPRASLIHTLTALRNIPSSGKSPRGSPFGSPRASISAQGNIIGSSGAGGGGGGSDLFSSPFPNLRPNPGRSPVGGTNRRKSTDAVNNPISPMDAAEPAKSSEVEPEQKPANNNNAAAAIFSNSSSDAPTRDSSLASSCDYSKVSSDDAASTSTAKYALNEKYSDRVFENALLNFEDIEVDKFRMEPSLIPRRLYLPWPTITVKAFCEYLYTGQIGNKWILAPTVLDNLLIAKFFRVPLLYDLISEVLFGIIGRKEAYIVGEGNKLKKKYFDLLEDIGIPIDPDFKFPLDEYEGFMDTVDDGYLDIALLKKTSKTHRRSTASTKKSTSTAFSSMRSDSIEPRGVGSTSTQGGSESRGVEDVVNEEEDEDDEISDDSKKSLEDEREYSLGYLDTYENSVPQIGSRSRSVFDKHSFMLQELKRAEAEAEKEDTTTINDDDQYEENANFTLEELVSPTAPVPSDYCVDLIFEASTIVSDLKLMLRAANLRAMTKILKRSRHDIEAAMAELEYQKGMAMSAKRNEELATATATAANASAASAASAAANASAPASANAPAATSATSAPAATSATSAASLATSVVAKSEETASSQTPSEKDDKDRKVTSPPSVLSSPSGYSDMHYASGETESRSSRNVSEIDLQSSTALKPSSSNNSVHTQKSTSRPSLSRTGSHASLRGISFTPFSKAKNKNESASDLTSMDKSVSEMGSSTHGIAKFRASILRGARSGEEFVGSSASSIKSGVAPSNASIITASGRKHGFFHIGHRKKETSGDESSLESARLERAASEVSISSGSKSDSGNNGKRKFGFRLKKSNNSNV
ncbi:MDS3 [[Candida] subhashii]|uniref:MDS3 n=1 Tax=[Candida] subhashii TaxID=561895 RepID=A0A8J5UXQ8_9ASCO|nr:MDS3 [[Candida] subhashii]KAG7662509.1 MDS3 [[Candida] subhashii]